MKSQKYNASKIIIITTTLYNFDSESDKLRAAIAKRTFSKAKELGYLVIAIDGGSHSDFINEIKSLGVKVSPQKEKGLGNSRTQAFKEAYETGKEIIIWTEPEKESFITEIEKVILPLLENKADIIIPRRKSLSTYPLAQQYIESFGNAFWKELTSIDLDIWGGMRAFKRELCRYFLDYKGEYGNKWEILLVPIMNMIIDKKRIASIEIDYIHPREQTRVEEHNLEFYKKRVEQLNNLTIPLEEYWKELNKKYSIS